MTTVDHYQFEEIKHFRFGHSPIGRPNLYTHVYVIDGLLIDTGQRKVQKLILQALDSLPLEQLFITHHHEDHTGNLLQVMDRYKLNGYASASCCELMQNPPPISFAQRMVWGDRPPVTGLIPIEGELRTSHHVFQLIPIPGHAPDMLALYEPERQWLFSADLFVSSYIGYFLEDESIRQQIASSKKILKLDFKVLLCSHNPRFIDGREKLKAKLDYLEGFNEKITNEYKTGLNAKEIYRKLKMTEHGFIHILSGGLLSKMNMVKSVIRDFENSSGE